MGYVLTANRHERLELRGDNDELRPLRDTHLRMES